MMSDFKKTFDAIREYPVVAELEKRLTVKANEELAYQYMTTAKPSYLCTSHNNHNLSKFYLSKFWQSDFLSTRRVTASCFYNFFASNDDDDTEDKPLTLAFASFNELTDDLKALILKPAIWTFFGLYHAARFTLKILEVIAHLVVAALDWIHLKVQENQHGINIFDGKGAQDIKHAKKTLNQDLNNAYEAGLDLAESGIKMMAYPFMAGYELPAQLVSIIVRSLCSYNGASNADVAQAVNDRVDDAKSFVFAASH
jgi:hypothetical protein